MKDVAQPLRCVFGVRLRKTVLLERRHSAYSPLTFRAWCQSAIPSRSTTNSALFVSPSITKMQLWRREVPYKFHIRQTTQTPATQPSTQRAVHWLAAVKSSTCLRPSSARARRFLRVTSTQTSSVSVMRWRRPRVGLSGYRRNSKPVSSFASICSVMAE